MQFTNATQLRETKRQKKYGLDKQIFPDIHVSHYNQGRLTQVPFIHEIRWFYIH